MTKPEPLLIALAKLLKLNSLLASEHKGLWFSHCRNNSMHQRIVIWLGWHLVYPSLSERKIKAKEYASPSKCSYQKLCNLYLGCKSNDGTIFSTWKTILKRRPNLQGKSMYSIIVLSKCTDFSQPKADWKCAQFFWALLISLCIFFHDRKLTTKLFGKRYTAAVHILYSVWEKWVCPLGEGVSLKAEFLIMC